MVHSFNKIKITPSLKNTGEKFKRTEKFYKRKIMLERNN